MLQYDLYTYFYYRCGINSARLGNIDATLSSLMPFRVHVLIVLSSIQTTIYIYVYCYWNWCCEYTIILQTSCSLNCRSYALILVLRFLQLVTFDVVVIFVVGTTFPTGSFVRSTNFVLMMSSSRSRGAVLHTHTSCVVVVVIRSSSMCCCWSSLSSTRLHAHVRYSCHFVHDIL